MLRTVAMMAELLAMVCFGYAVFPRHPDLRAFGIRPQESIFQRLGITKRQILSKRVERQAGLRSMRFAQAAKDWDCIFGGSKASSPMIKRTKGVS
jgi:hypothetical protein